MESLFILRGIDQGLRLQLNNEDVTIGRDPHNRLRLDDKEVSRFHAVIQQTSQGKKIKDLNSSNGVYVNGVKVEEILLKNGDQIEIGQSLLLFATPPMEMETTPEIEQANLLEHSKADASRIVHSLATDIGEQLFQNIPEERPETEWLAKAKAHLNLMYHTTLVVSQTLDIDHLLSRIMDLIFEWVNIDRGCILLYNSENSELIPKVSRHRPGNHALAEWTISRTILDYVLSHHEGVLTSDAQSDQRWDPDGSILQAGIREAICVPMRGRYGPVGVIYIDTSTGANDLLINASSQADHETQAEIATHGKLSQDHLKLMIAIAHQAALAVEDTRYYRGMVQAERLAAVGKTAAVLSHHIKNILQGIRGGSYLIDNGLKEHDENLIHKGWKIVDKNQKKISDLILDMLTFSKERTPSLQKGNINQIVDDVIELMQGRCLDLGTKLDFQPDKEIPPFFFDGEQLHRAITNLVTNAIDATLDNVMIPTNDGQEDLDGMDFSDSLDSAPNDSSAENQKMTEGIVSVQTRFNAAIGTVQILVDDNGSGIPDDVKDTLFRPFLSKNKSNGTGIGLAVTNKIVQEHKGHVTIEASPLGGARFVISLPLRQTAN